MLHNVKAHLGCALLCNCNCIHIYYYHNSFCIMVYHRVKYECIVINSKKVRTVVNTRIATVIFNNNINIVPSTYSNVDALYLKNGVYSRGFQIVTDCIVK